MESKRITAQLPFAGINNPGRWISKLTVPYATVASIGAVLF